MLVLLLLGDDKNFRGVLVLLFGCLGRFDLKNVIDALKLIHTLFIL